MWECAAVRFSRELPLTSLISTILLSGDKCVIRGAGEGYSGNDHMEFTSIMIVARSPVLVWRNEFTL